ncbi:MAG: DUF362 domain-containing protein [Armatimonadota bacterium]
MANDRRKLDRRQFIRRATGLGAGLTAASFSGCDTRVAQSQNPPPPTPPPTPAGKSQLVLAKHDRSVLGGQIDASVAAEMLEGAMLKLTGADTARDAWGSLFSADEVVGVKINCLFGIGASTHPEVTSAVVAGLIAGGVKPDNIIVWDRADKDLLKSGYEIKRDGPGPRCYGTDGAYEPEATKHRSFNGRLTKILTEDIDALVNVPILKDHGISGITVSMKNHYGSFDNPNKHHGNHCDPYIADFNSLGVVRQKSRLIVCDALLPVANGGPRARPEHTWPYRGMLVGQDPVALDQWGWQILEERRAAVGLPTLAEANRAPRQLESAASLGLGTNDQEQIDLVEV